MQHNPNSRLEAFCDGVFAIAITLLILEIKIPHVSEIHSSNDLWRALAHEWPSWFAFILGFGTILIGWVNHSAMMGFVDKTSQPFMYANGFLLFTIVVWPFATWLMAEYLATDYAQPAIMFYCIFGLLSSIAWNLLAESMAKPFRILKDEITDDEFKDMQKKMRMGFVLYSGIIVIAVWFAYIALALLTAMWLMWLLLGIMYHKKTNAKSKLANE